MPFRITKMHAGASGCRFALQKCMPERPDAVSHYKNACRRAPDAQTTIFVVRTQLVVRVAQTVLFVVFGGFRALEPLRV